MSSENGFSDSFNEHLMEIQIKTLMGTTFDINVSPRDTVMDIKRKIFRVEGIPIYNQNLIFRAQELKDSVRLCDSGIQNGSTLTLITNMKGGPISISTRRLSLGCEHQQMVLKELKKLLENTREEFTPGSKISVLVFKEGDNINLLRVIENEDGSYSPYNSENPISPPTKSAKKGSQLDMFQRLVEDTQMCTKIGNLRKKMTDASLRRQNKDAKQETGNAKLAFDPRLFRESALNHPVSCNKNDDNDMNYTFLEKCASEVLDQVDMNVFEKNLDEETPPETEEVALKDKHRIKPRILQPVRPKIIPPLIIKHPSPKIHSLYKERKGAYSHTKQNYTWMQRKISEGANSREKNMPGIRGGSASHLPESSNSTPSASETSFVSSLDSIDDIGAKYAKKLQLIDDMCGENSFSMSARNRVHLTRLVLSEGAERPKSSPDSMELEEQPPDLWEIHESHERLNHSATCKVGLLKHRQGLEYDYDRLENPSTSKINTEGGGGGNYSKASTADYGVCSGANYYVPQFMSAPSAIPPQYAPKQPDYFDMYLRDNLSRSPLYGKKNSRKENEETSPSLKEDGFPPTFLTDCSSIQRLKNDHPYCTSVTTRNTTSVSCTTSSTHNSNNISYSNLPPHSRREEANSSRNLTNLRLEPTTVEQRRTELTSNSTSLTNLRLKGSIENQHFKSNSSNNMDSFRLDSDVFGPKSDFLDALSGFCKLGLSSNVFDRTDIKQEEPILPPVITKKKSRCNECNKRLNITNIYNCRCGRIFCSQHRYSEAHRCTYDYKTDGRKILEHQNPLVTAEKIKRF